MEGIATEINVCDKNCNGCVRHSSDIMITLRVKDSPEFNDFFLSNEQAEKLVADLQKRIAINKQD